MGSLKRVNNYGTTHTGEGGYRKVFSKNKDVGPVIKAYEIAHPLTSLEYEENIERN